MVNDVYLHLKIQIIIYVLSVKNNDHKRLS